jgi:hypothetical protein
MPSMQVPCQLLPGHHLLLLGAEITPAAATGSGCGAAPGLEGGAADRHPARTLLRWQEGVDGSLLVNLSTLPALLTSPCLYRHCMLECSRNISAGGRAVGKDHGALGSSECAGRTDSRASSGSVALEVTAEALLGCMRSRAADDGMLARPVVCRVSVQSVAIGAGRVHKSVSSDGLLLTDH